MLEQKEKPSEQGENQQQSQLMQINILKTIYLNCGERHEDLDDHRSYIHVNLNFF